MFDFSSKTIIITGAAGNLGQAVVEAFWNAGANLAPVDREKDRLVGTFSEMVNSPRVLMVNSVNLTEADTVDGMVRKVISRFGHIDVLVNVAGGFEFGDPIDTTSWDTWHRMITMNVQTVVTTCRAVAPIMKENGSGKIINVAARAGLEGKARIGAYSASKAAVIRLTESMSAELKKYNININCIMPGTIDTEDNRQAMPKADPDKWVTPRALADVILFLASDASRAIHGAAIPVYGLG
ncbi:MAG: SDR family NAD(P)-dependent oxidoreductase [Anaerolineales bacterium]|nr:SDR family NAD(P)-dependent oxidoreductase [Anaerolineales bacterium]